VPSDVCDKVSDGCGGFIACHSCPSGQFCGADSKCTSATCSMAPVMSGQCGFVSDGCGGSQDGVTCAAPDTCGGGSKVDVCGCTPKTCEQAGAACGADVDDGCGGHLSCGACSESPGTCVDHHCRSCVPVPDSALGFEAKCGAAGNAHPHAWACGCTGGACDVPDTGCAPLTTTAEHAVYCCTASGATASGADGG
jgi:hypothetical protein